MAAETVGTIALPKSRMRSQLMAQRLRAVRWFLLPMMFALAVVAGWPLLRSIWFSFTDAKLNELYSAEHTYMLFGDAKGVVGELVKNLSGGSGMH